MSNYLKYLDEFIEVYQNRPLKNNAGGMGFNHSYAFYYILKRENPKTVIESGIWKGHSTYIIDCALPEVEIYCLDTNFANREYVSKNANYYETDFNDMDWTIIDNLQKTLCFFDDHQNSLERLKEMKWWGFKQAVFEDNYPISEGDSYSIKQVMEGSGHDSIQLSKKFLPKRKRDKLKRRLEEKILNKYYFRQRMIVRPNQIDRSGLNFNLYKMEEIPPVMTNKSTVWETKWEGPYLKHDDLINKESIDNFQNFKQFINANRDDLDYGYITFLELK